VTDVWVLVFVFALLAAAVFVAVSLRVRRRGGSLVTGALGRGRVGGSGAAGVSMVR
jgi:hypothetical protein